MYKKQGQEEAMKNLAPHMKELLRHHEESSAKYVELVKNPHELLGHILKCHLIVEHYLNIRIMKEKGYSLKKIQKKLKFSDKVKLLSKKDNKYLWKKSLLELNDIRNHFGHHLDATLDDQSVDEMKDILTPMNCLAGDEDKLAIIDIFTATAANALDLLPPEIEAIYKEAFKGVTIVLDKPVDE